MKLPRRHALLGLGLALVTSALALPSRPLRADDAPDTAGKCIRATPEARYRGLGYNHIVHVVDSCSTAAECDVSTDVAPKPIHVGVPAKGEVEVTTFLGSPARVFVPKVDCVMAK
jgi:hypothetical protein